MILFYLLGNFIIPNSLSIISSILNIGTAITFMSFLLIAMFAYLGFKVHADMNSTFVGTVAIGIGFFFKLLFRGIINLFKNIFRSFHKITKDGIIASILSILALIIII